MDQNGGIERGGGEDGTVFGVRPGELVDGTGVASEGSVWGVGITGDVVDFDGTILIVCTCIWMKQKKMR